MAKLKYCASVTVYRDYYIVLEAESKDDAYSIIRDMGPEELEAKGELSSWEVYNQSIYLDDKGTSNVLGKQKGNDEEKERTRSRQQHN